MTPAPADEAFLRKAEGLLRRDPPTWPGPTGRPNGDHAIEPKRWVAGGKPGEPRLAAVLVPLVCDEDGAIHLLFTERAAGLRNHAGQISFPGGKVDPGESAHAAALREADEEIGLAPAAVRTLGYLDGYLSGTGFFVVPVVGILERRPTLRLNPVEVASAFEVPLAFVLQAGNLEVHARKWRGAVRQYYAMPFGDRYIWGVTAGILHNFTERLGHRCSA